jgi:hypothetical protein
LIQNILAKHLELLTDKLEENKLHQGINEWYIQIGKRIEDISDYYPASYEDAAVIYEEWCKGILSEKRPDENVLREYAAYTARSDIFNNWIKLINSMKKAPHGRGLGKVKKQVTLRLSSERSRNQ